MDVVKKYTSNTRKVMWNDKMREVPLEELGAYGKIVVKKRKKGGAE